MCHATERLRERYGLEAVSYDLRDIARLIEAGRDAIKVRGGRGNTEVWDVRFKGEVLRVVYLTDRSGRGRILTALPSSGGDDTRRPREKRHKRFDTEFNCRAKRVWHKSRERALAEQDLDLDLNRA